MNETKSKLLIYSGISIASLAICLLVGEVFIRSFFPQQETQRWFEPHPVYGHVLKKDFKQKYHFLGSDFSMDVQTNSLGLRDREYQEAEFSDEKNTKVLLVGDSFVFGHGVNTEDHFKFHLEKQLNDSNRGRFLVINTGVGGWGTLQQIKFAEDHFELFKPDIVVLTFCTNDPGDDAKYLSRLESGKFKPSPFKKVLTNYSHLFRLFSTRIKNIAHYKEIQKRMKETTNTLDRQTASLVLDNEWQLARKRIGEFAEAFKKFNPKGKLLVQATAPWRTEVRKNLQPVEDDSTSVFYVDLFDQTRELPEEEKRLPFDGHWSEKVHKISAEKLGETVLGLLRRDK